MGFLDRLKRASVIPGPSVPPPTLLPPPTAHSGLRDLAGGADRITVVDCETTGVYNTDRVVELAIITLDLDGQVVDSWDTLVHPRRDVGASHIHGLTAHSLRDAPTFEDIAGDVAIRLHGSCMAAHNLPFDKRMLCGEFSRLNTELTVLSGIDTLTATRARLSAACAERRIPHHHTHSAIADATATAELLRQVATVCAPGSPSAAPHGLVRSGRVLRRADVAPVALPDPPHVVALATALNHQGLEGNVLSYLEVVGRAVADLHVDADERQQLQQIAVELGLGPALVAQAHRRYVNDLIDAALNDLILTEAELDMLLRVATALDVSAHVVEHRTRPAQSVTATVVLTRGQSVTFTGDDPDHPREELLARAAELGLTVGGNVTKKTNLLVAGDVSSSSGKALKAHSYSVPIISAAQFATAELGDEIDAETTAIEAKKVVRCPDCHTTWTVSARSGAQNTRRCNACAGVRPDRSTRPAPTKAVESPATETLNCLDCGRAWTRDRVRGRKPHRCPDCAGSTAT